MCLKTAWLVAVVTILFTGTFVSLSSPEASVPLGKAMFFVMFLLSFPTSAFSFLFSIAFVDPSHTTDLVEFILGWLIMFIGGIVQWFIIVPNLAPGPELTTLKLNSAPSSENRSEPAINIIIETAITDQTKPQPSVALPLCNDRSKKRVKRKSTITALDRKGRTPLERVIARS